MKTPGEIARELRTACHISQQELADYMTAQGCPTTRDAIKRAEANGFTDQRLLLLCKRLGIDDPVETFLGDSTYSRLNEKGLKALQEAKDLILAHKPYLKQPTMDLRLVPLSVSAGRGVDGDVDADDTWVTVPLADVPSTYKPEDLRVARVCGRSMEPELHEGEHFIFAEGGEPRPGHIIVCYYDDSTMVKIFRCNGRERWLESLNPDFEPIPLKFDMVYHGEYQGKTTVLAQNRRRHVLPD